jgi:hypothetical protein
MKETKKTLLTPPRRTLEEMVNRSKDDEVVFTSVTTKEASKND